MKAGPGLTRARPAAIGKQLKIGRASVYRLLGRLEAAGRGGRAESDVV